MINHTNDVLSDAMAELELQHEERVSTAIRQTIQSYGLAPNEALESDLVGQNILPTRSTKKLAFLIAAYKREATIDLLKEISDQPAGIARTLRRDGFVFQDDGRVKPNYQYKNADGVTCRRILNFRPLSAPQRGWTKELIQKSIAAAISSIEIYNKPDFHYREETYSILLVNAWELMAKARILQKNGGKKTSIFVKNAEGELEKTSAGNPKTLGLIAATKRLVSDGDLDSRCFANLKLLTEIRDNSVHFINKDPYFATRMQEIGAAALSNFVSACAEWFGIDLSSYNFYLMPLTFHPPAELLTAPPRCNRNMENLLKHLREVQAACPSDENSPYSVALSISIKISRTSAHDNFAVRWTNEQDAPTLTITEEETIARRFPHTYRDVLNHCRSKYVDFKQDKRFYAIKRELENPEKHGPIYCMVRYLDP